MKTIKRLELMPKNAEYITKDDRAGLKVVCFWTKNSKPVKKNGIWHADKESVIDTFFYNDFPRGEIARIKD